MSNRDRGRIVGAGLYIRRQAKICNRRSSNKKWPIVIVYQR